MEYLTREITGQEGPARQPLSGYDHRTSAAAGSRLWNSLPVQLRDPDIM